MVRPKEPGEYAVTAKDPEFLSETGIHLDQLRKVEARTNTRRPNRPMSTMAQQRVIDRSYCPPSWSKLREQPRIDSRMSPSTAAPTVTPDDSSCHNGRLLRSSLLASTRLSVEGGSRRASSSGRARSEFLRRPWTCTYIPVACDKVREEGREALMSCLFLPCATRGYRAGSSSAGAILHWVVCIDTTQVHRMRDRGRGIGISTPLRRDPIGLHGFQRNGQLDTGVRLTSEAQWVGGR